MPWKEGSVMDERLKFVARRRITPEEEPADFKELGIFEAFIPATGRREVKGDYYQHTPYGYELLQRRG